MTPIMGFMIFVYVKNEGWSPIKEGPFQTREEAIRFAEAEIGVPWLVMHSGSKTLYAIGDFNSSLEV
jgi:hypothetical protein